LGAGLDTDEKIIPTFDELWEALCQKVKRDKFIELDGRSDKSRHRLALIDGGIEGENILSQSESRFFVCQRDHAKLLWHNFADKEEVNSGDIKSVIPEIVGEAAFNAVILNELKRMALDFKVPEARLAHRFLKDQLDAQ